MKTDLCENPSKKVKYNKLKQGNEEGDTENFHCAFLFILHSAHVLCFQFRHCISVKITENDTLRNRVLKAACCDSHLLKFKENVLKICFSSFGLFLYISYFK